MRPRRLKALISDISSCFISLFCAQLYRQKSLAKSCNDGPSHNLLEFRAVAVQQVIEADRGQHLNFKLCCWRWMRALL
jgi:hypothetical protein